MQATRRLLRSPFSGAGIMARQALAVLALTVFAAEALVDPQFQSFLNVGKLRNCVL